MKILKAFKEFLFPKMYSGLEIADDVIDQFGKTKD